MYIFLEAIKNIYIKQKKFIYSGKQKYSTLLKFFLFQFYNGSFERGEILPTSQCKINQRKLYSKDLL